MALGLVREAASAEIRRMPYRLRDGKRIVYEDSFLAERTYGGQRKHYGTDLMDLDNTPGEIPIYSMTYGRVSRMGWNEKGGWRVGVTSAAGIYYYYAHLAAFAENLGVGDFVEPGSLLGYMGDSGYGPEGRQVSSRRICIWGSRRIRKPGMWGGSIRIPFCGEKRVDRVPAKKL